MHNKGQARSDRQRLIAQRRQKPITRIDRVQSTPYSMLLDAGVCSIVTNYSSAICIEPALLSQQSWLNPAIYPSRKASLL